MIVQERRLLFLLILIAITNLAIHIFSPLDSGFFEDVMAFKMRSRPVLNNSKALNISLNWKTLYDRIVLKENKTQNLGFNQTNHQQRLIKKTDLMFHYYFEAGSGSVGDNVICPLIPPDLERFLRWYQKGISMNTQLLLYFNDNKGEISELKSPIAEDKDIMNLYGIDDMVLRIQPGGIHSPVDCVAQQQIAIVVAVHETHERIRNYIGSFLYYIHPFLMKQQLEYQIFIVLKVSATAPYKRGKLYNIGFKAAQSFRNGSWDCVIFHDAYLVPLDTRNLYRCSLRPKRLIADTQTPYRFGGAVAIRPNHFVKVNGFSNLAWSNDDDYIDMYRRLIAENFTVETNLPPIGNYTSFECLKQINNESLQSVTTQTPFYLQDGLSNVTNTSKIELRQFYSLIEVLFDT